jgi:hypothetical protein
MSSKVYFFLGATYYRYDRGGDRVDDGYPLAVAANWPGLAAAGFGDRIDAAVNWENGKLYFFRGAAYVRYDLAGDRVDDGFPRQIAEGWPSLANAGFGSDIDAALNWGNGKAYFFKGGRYVRYDIAADKVDDGFPVGIANGWPGFANAGFAEGLSGALNWGDGKAYFFRGAQYLRYDIANDLVDDGYPLAIAGNWPGLPADVRAVVDGLDLVSELWLSGAEVVRSPVSGPRYAVAPWRGVLHTTEGATCDAALTAFRSTNFWPHLTIEPRTLRVVQHLPLTIGARALSDSIGPENSMRCVQIEIVGFAAETPTWAPEQLAFVGGVMRQIEGAVPVPHRSGLTFLDAAGVNRTPSNRMTLDAWKRFAGWCGHQHAPGENHWDPGAIDIDALLAG